MTIVKSIVNSLSMDEEIRYSVGLTDKCLCLLATKKFRFINRTKLSIHLNGKRTEVAKRHVLVHCTRSNFRRLPGLSSP